MKILYPFAANDIPVCNFGVPLQLWSGPGTNAATFSLQNILELEKKESFLVIFRPF